MPESLQQKVDRMTAGMEVTVTFNGTRPGTVTGPVTSDVMGVLFVVGRPVRFNDGRVNPFITAIDMPDPECPFEIGARVRVAGHGWVYIVAGWDYYDAWKAWFVRAEVESERESHGLWRPDELTLVPPEPAEHDHKGFSEEKCVRCGWIMGRAPLNCMNDDTPHVFPSQQQRASDRCERVEPAEPDCPAILVTGVDGISNALTRDVLGRYAALPLSDWLESSHVATVQALRPAEYLRGGR